MLSRGGEEGWRKVEPLMERRKLEDECHQEVEIVFLKLWTGLEVIP